MASFLRSPSFVSPPPAKLQYSSSPPSLPASPSPRSSQTPTISVKSEQKPKPTTTPESTDWIASTLSRRFGLGAGLAWAAFLAVGVVSEQIKTRLEAFQQEANTIDVEKGQEIVLPNGIRYSELRVGGGGSPKDGDLVVLDLMGKVEGSGTVFVDTFNGEKRPLALVLGSRPYSKGMCEGIEVVLRSMKAGGKRRVTVPPALAFGEKGADLGEGLQVPPSATLQFIVQVDKEAILFDSLFRPEVCSHNYHGN